MMAGDMHVAPPDTLDRVAARARRRRRRRHRRAARPDRRGVGRPTVHQADATMGVTTDDLLAAVTKAAAAAQEGAPC